MRTQVYPSVADWHVEIIIGRTFCPEMEAGKRCNNRSDHDRRYGTETSTVDGWYAGDKPTPAERRAMVPVGWYLIESTVKACV